MNGFFLLSFICTVSHSLSGRFYLVFLWINERVVYSYKSFISYWKFINLSDHSIYSLHTDILQIHIKLHDLFHSVTVNPEKKHIKWIWGTVSHATNRTVCVLWKRIFRNIQTMRTFSFIRSIHLRNRPVCIRNKLFFYHKNFWASVLILVRSYRLRYSN